MEDIVQVIVVGIVIVVIAVCVTFYEKDKADKIHELKMIEATHAITE